MTSHYTILIQWSEDDQCYVVSLPEWGEFCHTHGTTYAEALANAQAVLELLITSAQDKNEPLPPPQLFGRSLQMA